MFITYFSKNELSVFPQNSLDFNSFDINLFNELCKNSTENENIFFSPLNISLALSMLLIGSDKATKKEIEKVLGIVENKQLLYELKNLNETSTKSLSVELDSCIFSDDELLNTSVEVLSVKLASCIFPDESFKVIQKYLADLKTAFNCEVQRLDYKQNAEESKSTINKWVERCTEGKIKNLFTSIKPETACVLVSCIYFKGDWYDEFDSYYTHEIVISTMRKGEHPLSK